MDECLTIKDLQEYIKNLGSKVNQDTKLAISFDDEFCGNYRVSMIGFDSETNTLIFDSDIDPTTVKEDDEDE